MKRKKNLNNLEIEDDVLQNIKWFKKFPLNKRLEIVYLQMKAIKTLRNLKIKNL